MRGSLSWQRGKDGTGAALPNGPERLAKFLALVPLGLYELAWETYYTGPRPDIFGARVGGQTISHAAVSGRFNRDLRWQVRLRNLFDQRVPTVVGAEYSLGAAGNVATVADYGRQLQFDLTADF
jgi:outer membrane receptor protein involved in Fe transport